MYSLHDYVIATNMGCCNMLQSQMLHTLLESCKVITIASDCTHKELLATVALYLDDQAPAIHHFCVENLQASM